MKKLKAICEDILERKNVLTNSQFWLALIIVILGLLLALGSYLDMIEIIEFRIAQYTLHHWFTITGTFFIAVFTPIFYFFKRRYINRYKAILSAHVFGNLIAFVLITIHFAHQIGRPAQFYPDLGTGIVLYPAVILLVISGFSNRFNLFKGKRYFSFLHKSVPIMFYFVIVVHLLHGLRII